VANNVGDSDRALSAARNVELNLDKSAQIYPSLILKAILWDMAYTHDRAEAIELANSICRVIKSKFDSKILGVKGARFFVLKGVRSPAILIEVGFLSNRQEENLLRNAFYRQKVAEGIKEGIINYARELALVKANN
jgi:N-acetylmuramoyl-L-alanine amidase